MTDKVFIKIQDDIKKSNPIIINNDDNVSNIKKNLLDKYTENISDSEDDELSSYKKRNSNVVNNINSKTKKSSTKKVSESISKLDEESDYDSEVEYEFQKEFEEKVKAYVKADDKIRELQTEIKNLTFEKKKTEPEILKHLERLGDNKINISGGKLSINQYETKEGFKENLVKDVMTEKIKDPKIISKIIESINEKRVKNAKVQISLKRTFEKNKNDKKK